MKPTYEDVRAAIDHLRKTGQITEREVLRGKHDGQNITITEEELKSIRSLSDFDLTMLLSEINEFGWIAAKNPNIGGRALLVTILASRTPVRDK
jgi:hypothetical protein